MLRLIVCIKQVPDTQEVRLDPVTHTLKRGGVKAIINPFDLYALEEALRIKDCSGGSGHGPHHGSAPGRSGPAGGIGDGAEPRCSSRTGPLPAPTPGPRP